MTSNAVNLPSFKSPPLIEVAFSAAFYPNPQVSVAHLGRWWDVLGREEFPQCSEQPPLAQVQEVFGQVPALPRVDVSFPAPRLWFVSRDQQQVVQVQRDRFLCNWRRTQNGSEYPHYDAVSGDFFSKLESYAAFVRDETGKDLAFTQFELTYINHVLDPSIDEGFGDIGQVLPDLVWRDSERFLPDPSGLEARLSFDLPDGRSRLHTKANTGHRRDDGKAVLILDLTTRGHGEDLQAWFATAHEWIVRGFADLTSSRNHQAWGRIR